MITWARSCKSQELERSRRQGGGHYKLSANLAPRDSLGQQGMTLKNRAHRLTHQRRRHGHDPIVITQGMRTETSPCESIAADSAVHGAQHSQRQCGHMPMTAITEADSKHDIRT